MIFTNSLSVLRHWIDGLNAGSPAEVIRLYAEHATLLPTFSPRALRTPYERRSYFEMLVAREGLRVSLHENTLHEDAIGGGSGSRAAPTISSFPSMGSRCVSRPDSRSCSTYRPPARSGTTTPRKCRARSPE